LRANATEDARAAAATLQKMSPTSLKITLRNIRAALSFAELEDSFRQDFRISLACIAEHDFIEGIRAAIVDKDRRPVWRPDKLEDVTSALVERHFKPLGALELTFPD
jgi:enoyl-CoA hydratase